MMIMTLIFRNNLAILPTNVLLIICWISQSVENNIITNFTNLLKDKENSLREFPVGFFTKSSIASQKEKKLSVISIKQKNCLELFLLIFTSISLSPVFVLFLPVFLQSLRVENNPALNRHFIVKEQIKSQKQKSKTWLKENLVGGMFSTRPSCAKPKTGFFQETIFCWFFDQRRKIKLKLNLPNTFCHISCLDGFMLLPVGNNSTRDRLCLSLCFFCQTLFFFDLLFGLLSHSSYFSFHN